MSRGAAFGGRRQQGFTLLEVMLAFVLLATAMGLLVAMLSKGLAQVRQAQRETEATLHAQSLLDQLGVLEPIKPGERSGQFDNGRYRYRLAISETADPAAVVEEGEPAELVIGAPKLYLVSLAVSWDSGTPAQQLRFHTLRARQDTAPDVITQ